MTTRGRQGQADFERDGRSGFNLGAHVGDAPQAVAQRRAAVDAHFGVKAVYLNQVHGTAVQVLSHTMPDLDAVPTADASSTTEAGLASVIMVADCLPVLACNRAGTWVGGAHAGWRGLAGGVLESLVDAYLQAGGPVAHAHDLLLWLGPCIGPTAFEVGGEVREAFVQRDAACAACFVPAAEAGKWLADLPSLARLRLAALGVGEVHGNDGSLPWCTVNHADQWFSHRRDQARLGSSGRMAAFIWREAPAPTA